MAHERLREPLCGSGLMQNRSDHLCPPPSFPFFSLLFPSFPSWIADVLFFLFFSLLSQRFPRHLSLSTSLDLSTSLSLDLSLSRPLFSGDLFVKESQVLAKSFALPYFPVSFLLLPYTLLHSSFPSFLSYCVRVCFACLHPALLSLATRGRPRSVPHCMLN